MRHRVRSTVQPAARELFRGDQVFDLHRQFTHIDMAVKERRERERFLNGVRIDSRRLSLTDRCQYGPPVSKEDEVVLLQFLDSSFGGQAEYLVGEVLNIHISHILSGCPKSGWIQINAFLRDGHREYLMQNVRGRLVLICRGLYSKRLNGYIQRTFCHQYPSRTRAAIA